MEQLIGTLSKKDSLLVHYLLKFIEFIKNTNRFFLYIVVLPTICALIYFGFWASDVYVSESSFVVRSLGTQKAENFYNIQDYLLSRDLLNILNQKTDLAQRYANKNIDIFHRFAPFNHAESPEALFRYYKKRVKIHLDPASSVYTIQLRAFSSQDAYDIHHELLNLGQQYLSDLNEKSFRDMKSFQQKEMNAAEVKVKNAELALTMLKRNATIKNKPIETNSLSFQRLVLDEKLAYKQYVNVLNAINAAELKAQDKQLFLDIISNPNNPDIAVEPYRFKDILSTIILCLILWGVVTLIMASVKEHLE